MFETRIYNRWEDFAALRTAWDRMVEHSAAPSVFLTWEWLAAWWQAYPGDRRLLAVVVSEADAGPVGAAPLFVARRKGPGGIGLRVAQFIGDGTNDSDNLDWIVPRERPHEALAALLDALTECRSEWDLLQLSTIPAESPLLPRLSEELAARRWAVRRETGPRVVLELPASWEEYHASLSSKMRDEFRKRLKKLEQRHRVRLWRCERGEDIAPALESLFTLHTRSWEQRGQPGSFAFPGRKDFYRRVAEEFCRQGLLDFWLLDADERTVAAEFGLRYGDARLTLLGGYDPDFAAFSIRKLLKALILRELIAAGVRTYDFLAGGEDHKLRWGGELREYVYLTVAPPGGRGALYLNTAVAAARTKEWARARIPNSAWEFFRRTYRRFRPYRKELSDG